MDSNNTHTSIHKIVVVGNYPPRLCGIATFTYDIVQSLKQAGKEVLVFNVSDEPEGYGAIEDVCLEISQNARHEYVKAAEFADAVNADIIYIQHEFGIFGGRDGRHILSLVENATVPVFVHLHTILQNPTLGQRLVMQQFKELVTGFVVMSQKGKDILEDVYEIAPERIQIIPHGIPDITLLERDVYKQANYLCGRKTILTFGLVSPNKGLETMIRALPKIVENHPEVTYLILGKTHPHIVREHGEKYRDSLLELAEDLGVADHIRFENRFVSIPELGTYIGACDIYVTPYLNQEQITSGTLSYAFGLGRAVVSTPYWHAEELLSEGNGVLFPFGDHESLATEIEQLLSDQDLRSDIESRAFEVGRSFAWSKIGVRICDAFDELIASSQNIVSIVPHRGLGKFDHLESLTDDTGVIQHARTLVPFREEGYCVDDNARALIVVTEAMMLENQQPLSHLANRYAAFVQDALNTELGTFRNFMSYDRKWLEDVGSDDSIARVLWCLAHTVAYSPDKGLRTWATNIYLDYAIPLMTKDASIRAWANSLTAASIFLSRYPGHQASKGVVEDLAARMASAFDFHSSEDWQWFEPYLVYDNARLCEAMIQAGQSLGDPYLTIGLQSLDWLNEQQTSPAGYFSPIGSNGFYARGKHRAQFDQQPLEAWVSASANRLAYEVTGESKYRNEVRRAVDWFYGKNDLGQPVVHADSGACRDGLQATRLNQNCGAESTLSYLGTMNELRKVENMEGILPLESEFERTSVKGRTGVLV